MSNEQPTGAPQNPQQQGGFPQPGAYSAQNPYPQGYPQQPYPQQPYAAPAYGQQPPAAPTPPAGIPDQNQYQITHYAAQYGQQSSQAYATEPYTTQALPQMKPRSGVPGIVAVALVVIAMIIAFATGMPASGVLRAYFAYAMTQPGQAALEEYIQSLMMSGAANQIGVAMLGMMVASLFGLAGVITGIVAAARNSGRLWGVIAIIAGLIAPFVVTGVIFA